VVPAVVARIQRMLDQQKKAFGGYLGRHYASHILTNSLYDHGDRDWFHDPVVTPTKGECIFWDGGHFPSQDWRPEKQCFRIVQQPWTGLELCGACF
jgi:hypothetical protein